MSLIFLFFPGSLPDIAAQKYKYNCRYCNKEKLPGFLQGQNEIQQYKDRQHEGRYNVLQMFAPVEHTDEHHVGKYGHRQGNDEALPHNKAQQPQQPAQQTVNPIDEQGLLGAMARTQQLFDLSQLFAPYVYDGGSTNILIDPVAEQLDAMQRQQEADRRNRLAGYGYIGF